jgi:hypothetical protein
LRAAGWARFVSVQKWQLYDGPIGNKRLKAAAEVGSCKLKLSDVDIYFLVACYAMRRGFIAGWRSGQNGCKIQS